MGLPVLRRPEARADLLHIWAFIARDSETAADRMLHRFERTFAMLADTPLAGRARPELARDLRSFVVGSHVVVYRVLPEGVAVIRVLSGYLDLDEAEFPAEG